MERISSAVFRQLLRKNRKELNALFETCRLAQPSLDGHDFLLRVERMLNAVHETGKSFHDPEGVMFIVFRKLLEMASAGFFSSKSSLAYLDLLSSLLIDFPGAFRENPEGFLASAANALWRMSRRSPGTALAWQSGMSALKGLDVDYETFRRGGVIAAWLNGLSEFRRAALELLIKSEAKETLRVLVRFQPERLDALLNDMSGDPWHQGFSENEALPVFIMCGDFTGFGGSFPEPPVLTGIKEREPMECERIAAGSGGMHFMVYAERSGSAVVEIRGDMPDGMLPPSRPDALSAGRSGLSVKGTLWPWEWYRRKDAESMKTLLGMPVLSLVTTRRLVAFTTPLSHRIFILALPGGRDA